MAWSGGTFSRALGANQWANDAAANVGIEAGIHDTQDNDLATGINACLNKNGQNSPTVDISMGGFKFTNAGVATATTHFATLGQVQNGTAVYCGTSGGAANVQTLSPSPAISSGVGGQRFSFIAGFTNTSTVTINTSGLGAFPVYNQTDGTAATGLVAGNIVAGLTYEVLFLGAVYILLNPTVGAWVTWSPTLTGFSVDPASFSYTYSKQGRFCTIQVYQGGAGTSNSTAFQISLPFAAAAGRNWEAPLAQGFDNGGWLTNPGFARIAGGSSTVILYTAQTEAVWTAANGKLARFQMAYETAA